MNISKNQEYIPTTKDGKLINEGDIVYWVRLYNKIPIVKFKVKYWNDGKTADLYFNNVRFDFRQYSPSYVNIKEYKTVGLYPEKEDNLYAFISVNECYADLINAQTKVREWLNEYNENILSSLEVKPKEIKSTHQR